MGRQNYQYLTVTGVGGINQQRDLADPQKELADARNVWAPNGRVIARPGYTGIAAFNFADYTSGAAGTATCVKEVAGTYTTTANLASLGVANSNDNTHFYLGFSAVMLAYQLGTGIGFDGVAFSPNTNSVGYRLSYWNGNSWIGLNSTFTEGGTAQRTVPSVFMNGTNPMLNFPWPGDMALLTIDSLSRYWFRVTLLPNTDTTFDAVVNLSATINSLNHNLNAAVIPATGDVVPLTMFAVQFPYTKRYIWPFLCGGSIASGKFIVLNTGIIGAPEANEYYDDSTTDFTVNEPASMAVIPQFEECYLTYNYKVSVHKAYPTSTDSVEPVLEDAVSVIGSGAPYDRNVVSQLLSWPQSKYIEFFRGELWAANLVDGVYSIRWSAPQPFYKVWPTLNLEVLMENDNSPITGLKGFQEHMTVFKNDSIWKMVDTGISDFSLQTYSPIRVVNGVGCVANSSIQEIRNQLVFLAEDGIYAYNGSPNIVKLSDPINDVISRIPSGRRAFVSSCHWKSKSLYLLSATVTGATNSPHTEELTKEWNNIVIVWDYKNNSWWVWDNVQAESFTVDESSSDNERVFFQDVGSRIFELGSALTDHGTAISSYVETHPLLESNDARSLRSVELTCPQLARSATVEVKRNDASSGTSATYDFTDDLEVEYLTATYGTSTYTKKRDRAIRRDFRENGYDFTAKVSHSTHNTQFEMRDLKLGFVSMGKRR